VGAAVALRAGVGVGGSGVAVLVGAGVAVGAGVGVRVGVAVGVGGGRGVAVAVGINEGGIPGADRAAEQITHFMRMEQMEVLGQVTATGNVPCLSCGYGIDCPTSAIPWIFGKVDGITEDMFKRVEDQTEVAELAIRLGREIREHLHKQI